MKKSRSSKAVKHKRVLESLRDVIAALPTEAEKKEVIAGSEAVIAFLRDLKAQAELLPTKEGMASTDEALAALERALEVARTKPVLSSAIGLAVQLGDRNRAQARTKDRLGGEALLESLRALPVDEIRLRLQAPSVSDGELRAVASILGLRPQKGAPRDGLVHQVAMSIANSRGYQQISAGAQASAEGPPQS